MWKYFNLKNHFEPLPKFGTPINKAQSDLKDYPRGHESMSESLAAVAEDLVKGKSSQIQEAGVAEGRFEPEEVYLRLWKSEHFVVLMNFTDDTWREGYVAGFWTDDPNLTFAGGLKIGSSLTDIKTFYDYNEEEAGILYFSDNGDSCYSYVSGSSITYNFKDGSVASIRYSINLPLLPKIKKAVIGTLIETETIKPAQSFNSNDYAKNLSEFVSSLVKNASRITWENPYSYQESEFIENEMLGDEFVYMRAWAGEYYFVVRSYSDTTYSSSVITNFWTNSSGLDFAGGIKVGSSLSDVYAFLGRDGMLETNKYTILDDGFCVDFRLNNGRVTEILYSVEASTTSTIYSLFSLNNGSIVEAEITGEKVNVRNAPDRSGKVLFQVSRSKGDKLIVDREAEVGWHSVSYHLIDQGISYKVDVVRNDAYIIGDFIRMHSLEPTTKDFLVRAIEREGGRNFIIKK